MFFLKDEPRSRRQALVWLLATSASVAAARAPLIDAIKPAANNGLSHSPGTALADIPFVLSF